MRVTRGSFGSSATVELPLEVRAVPVELVEPSAGSDRVVVLMPAWNDHGFETRRVMASLLAERGIASVMFDIPFYGARRIVARPDQAIRTVAAFMQMGMGAIDEARSLLAELARTRQVGVSGYSMGGNVAALVSATVPFTVATSVHAASYSPGPVYLDGIMERAIDWQALGGESQRDELRRRLSAVSVLDAPPLPHHETATLVGGTRDGFVPPTATEALHQHWAGSTLEWIEAGHATLLKRHASDLADAVADSFDRTRF
jgi:pimeloyl-ACP methyl ester carboxylesterase